ncbi:hypothetical protein [Paraburkholderia bannensis]|nr:hypothetical protein [Paraburkholderia bannensis]
MQRIHLVHYVLFRCRFDVTPRQAYRPAGSAYRQGDATLGG